MSETSIERPTGVTILAVLEIIVGILGIIGGLLAITVGGFLAAEGYGSFGALAGVLGGIAFILGLFALAVGWGLWNLRKWAYQIAMILAIIGIIVAIVTLPGSIISLVIDAIIIYYLTRPEIKDVFGITGLLS
ncbi:MAG: hypothetical protein ACE5R6_11740 [Candidatus Heimdallarchaeota archaeon]